MLLRFALCSLFYFFSLSCVSATTCGPQYANVSRVLDGDTIELDDGTRIRYLMVDTPEVGADAECFGAQARALNINLVQDETVELLYEERCQDVHGRTLAHVRVHGLDVGRELLRQGHACVLFIPPNGKSLIAEYKALEAEAREKGRGLWSQCPSSPCSR